MFRLLQFFPVLIIIRDTLDYGIIISFTNSLMKPWAIVWLTHAALVGAHKQSVPDVGTCCLFMKPNSSKTTTILLEAHCNFSVGQARRLFQQYHDHLALFNLFVILSSFYLFLIDAKTHGQFDRRRPTTYGEGSAALRSENSWSSGLSQKFEVRGEKFWVGGTSHTFGQAVDFLWTSLQYQAL